MTLCRYGGALNRSDVCIGVDSDVVLRIHTCVPRFGPWPVYGVPVGQLHCMVRVRPGLGGSGIHRVPMEPPWAHFSYIGCCNIACQNPSPSEARIPAPSAGAIKISMASSPGPSESQHRTPVPTTTTAISITIDWFARFPCRCSIPGAARHPQLKQEARCDDGGGQTLPVLGRPACSQSFWVLCSGAFPP
jgi:hypothetical protein